MKYQIQNYKSEINHKLKMEKTKKVSSFVLVILNLFEA